MDRRGSRKSAVEFSCAGLEIPWVSRILRIFGTRHRQMQSSESSGKGKYRLGRLEYLDQLVIEFQTTKSKDAKEQVLANLANFAYDPFNFNYFRQLNILDLFLDNLSESEETLVKFSIGGLCNLCLDPANKKYLQKNGLGEIKNLLNHGNEDVMLSAITTLMFLATPETKPDITSTDVISSMVKLSRDKNVRLGNLATIFLQDLCSEDQIRKASATHAPAPPPT